jgi:Domain of unknown function (DUF4304)
MSYTLLLFQVPPGASEDDVEKIAFSMTEAERVRGVGPLDPEKERRKRALVDALLADCPELKGGEPNYADLARAENISEEHARHSFHWWTVSGPEEGAGIEITLYDDYVSIDIPSAAGTDQDWKDVWRYLEILVAKGGFVVWDPQGPDLVDLAAGPFGEGKRSERLQVAKRRGKGRKHKTETADDDADSNDADVEDEDSPDVEREDVRRGGDIAKLINHIVNDAIAEPLAAAGFERFGRTWRRTLQNGLVHVVNVQWSPRQRGVEGIFGLNAGVYSRELAESIALYKPTSSPKEYDCQVRLRPGPHGRGRWQVRVPGIATPDPDLTGLFARVFAWLDRRADSKAGAQQVKVTRELREALEGHVFPAFERLSTLRALRDELARSPDLFWAAHASLLLGEREAAKQLLERTLKKASRNAEFSAMVREWGNKQGLL